MNAKLKKYQEQFRKMPFDIVSRRVSDVAVSCADPTLAKELLGWEARFFIDRRCVDSLRWQLMNPMGYQIMEMAFS